jgi:hypothetical protein
MNKGFFLSKESSHQMKRTHLVLASLNGEFMRPANHFLGFGGEIVEIWGHGSKSSIGNGHSVRTDETGFSYDSLTVSGRQS